MAGLLSRETYNFRRSSLPQDRKDRKFQLLDFEARQNRFGDFIVGERVCIVALHGVRQHAHNYLFHTMAKRCLGLLSFFGATYVANVAPEAFVWFIFRLVSILIPREFKYKYKVL